MEILETLNLKLGTITDNSLIVVKITHGVADMSEVQTMCNHLSRIAEKYPNIEILIIGSNMTLEIAPEKHMNSIGWFRKNEDGTAKIAQQ